MGRIEGHMQQTSSHTNHQHEERWHSASISSSGSGAAASTSKESEYIASSRAARAAESQRTPDTRRAGSSLFSDLLFSKCEIRNAGGADWSLAHRGCVLAFFCAGLIWGKFLCAYVRGLLIDGQ